MKNIANEIINITGEVEIVEEFLNVPQNLLELEKNRDLIRLEMNIVEYPIFSKSKLIKSNQILKYYFSTDKSSYLEITPKVNSQIPSEFDERVFIALTKILRDNNFDRKFYTTISQIIDNMRIVNEGTKKGFYKRVKISIERMANTNFKFKNLYYSNKDSGIVDDLIDTNMLSYRILTFKDAKDKEENLFSDKRVKEIYLITLSDLFHQNIIKKGYLTFDADELLAIKDPVTRAIYTMITKWRNRNLFLNKEAFFIARRIPLSWDNPYRTIKRLEKSCEELKRLNLISNFELVKKGKWDEAVFQFHFDEEHNRIKQQMFYDEKKLFGQTIAYVEERSHDDNTPIISGFDIDISEILNIFPPVAKTLKTLPNIIREALKKNEYTYVKYTAEYTAFNCKTSYLKYFKDALDKNWAEEYISKKELKVKKQEEKLLIPVIEEAQIIIENPIKVTWEEFEKLELVLQEKIEVAAYEEFLIQTESKDNKTIRGIFEKSKKTHILKIFNEFEIPQEAINIEEEVIENKITEKESLTENNVNTYVTVSSFIMECLKYFRENSVDINPQDFMTLFSFMKEFEDDKIRVIYNESTKIGKIIKK